MSVLLVGGVPLAAYAEDAPATSATTTTTTSATDPAPTATTPTSTSSTTSTGSQPTSSSSSTTTTTQTPPAPKPTYVYDSATGHWNSSQWQYDATSGTYKPTVTTVVPPPAPVPSSTSSSATNGVTSSTIANALNSVATSGDASILKNTAAGSATTGDASSAATILNNVNSTMTNANNTQAATFVSNVMGDVNGDIMLQPMLLKAMLEANAANTSTATNTTNTGLTDNVSLSANSGNATVSGNTSAGSATTGSANTVANVVNVINSMVAANQSFIGTINIYGNLNGDILIAPDFIPQLLAANGGTSATAVGTANVTNTTDQTVVNNIALAAKTGTALVTGNTSAGNATTGNATTNTVIFNLTNHAIVASDSLLVFVNVLGHWVGVIVDAPTGATSAAIGDGVTSNTVSPSLTVNASNNTLLTNNINLSSQSGDATVTHNTSAGNATTGNATASANVANITGSQIGLSGWFGVLFINVFGSWLGSFGINTSAGNPISQPQNPGQPSAPVKVIDFIPHTVRQAPATMVVHGSSAAPIATQGDLTSAPVTGDVLAATTSQPQTHSKDTTSTQSPDLFNIPVLIGALALLGGLLIRLRSALLS